MPWGTSEETSTRSPAGRFPLLPQEQGDRAEHVGTPGRRTGETGRELCERLVDQRGDVERHPAGRRSRRRQSHLGRAERRRGRRRRAAVRARAIRSSRRCLRGRLDAPVHGRRRWVRSRRRTRLRRRVCRTRPRLRMPRPLPLPARFPPAPAVRSSRSRSECLRSPSGRRDSKRHEGANRLGA